MSTSALMTLPSAESDLLMAAASLRRWPAASDARCRSDPARSTKCSVPLRRRHAPAPGTGRALDSRETVKRAWEREDSRLAAVAPTARDAAARANSAHVAAASAASGQAAPSDTRR